MIAYLTTKVNPLTGGTARDAAHRGKEKILLLGRLLALLAPT